MAHGKCSCAYTKPVSNACSNRPPFLKLTPASVECGRNVEPATRRSTQTTTTSRSHQKHPAAAHSQRMDRTLSDLVSLISHFGPVQSIKLPSSSVKFNPNTSNQQGTKENPIQVDDCHPAPAPSPSPSSAPIDAVNNALIALASTVASALKLSNASQDHPPLSEPAVHHVLQSIKHDPKLIPTLQATHEYLNSVPTYHLSQAPGPTGNTVSNPPSRPKRKRKHTGPRVPAGAEHWDVPFPFAPGHAPAGYPTQWQLERGRRVLGELLGLFERAFVQSRISRDSSFFSETNLETSEPPPSKRPRLSSTCPSFSEKKYSYSDTQVTAEQVFPPTGLDAQRMTEWLSSISAPPPPMPIESIIDRHISTNTSSFNATTSHLDFSLDDISNIMDISSSDVSMPSQLPTMDFTQLFDALHCHPLNSDYDAAIIGPRSAPDYSIDLVPSVDAFSKSFNPDASSASLPTVLLEDFPRVDLDSVEVQSMQTIPTASGSSSVREGTPLEPPSPEAQNSYAQEKRFNSTQLQRKATLLFRAQEYRKQLLQELDRVTVKKWELQIEEGVLQNLQKATGSS